MKIKRTFNARLIRRDYPYSIGELAEVYGVHKNTIGQWIRAGLKPIDSRKPILIHGSTIITFLNARKTSGKHQCKPNEFYCLKCRVPRLAWGNIVDITIRNHKQVNLSAICSVCETKLNRAGTVERIPDYRKIFVVQTEQSPHIIDRINPLSNSDLNKEHKHERF